MSNVRANKRAVDPAYWTAGGAGAAPSIEVALYVAGHPNIPREFFHELMYNPDWQHLRWRVSGVIAGNRHAPSDLLLALHEFHPSTPLARILAENPSTPDVLLTQFTESVAEVWRTLHWVDWKMAVRLLENPSLPLNAMETLAGVCVEQSLSEPETEQRAAAYVLSMVAAHDRFPQVDSETRSRVLVVLAVN